MNFLFKHIEDIGEPLSPPLSGRQTELFCRRYNSKELFYIWEDFLGLQLLICATDANLPTILVFTQFIVSF